MREWPRLLRIIFFSWKKKTILRRDIYRFHSITAIAKLSILLREFCNAMSVV